MSGLLCVHGSIYCLSTTAKVLKFEWPLTINSPVSSDNFRPLTVVNGPVTQARTPASDKLPNRFWLSFLVAIWPPTNVNSVAVYAYCVMFVVISSYPMQILLPILPLPLFPRLSFWLPFLPQPFLPWFSADQPKHSICFRITFICLQWNLQVLWHDDSQVFFRFNRLDIYLFSFITVKAAWSVWKRVLSIFINAKQWYLGTFQKNKKYTFCCCWRLSDFSINFFAMSC